MDVYKNLAGLGITLSPVQPAGIYATVVPFGGNLVCTSGHNCKAGDILPHVGRVGAEVTLEQAAQDARQCAINLLGSLHAALGDLNRISRIVKITGYVASADGFYQQPKVLDGASALLVQVFGPHRGKAARTAVGVSTLANNQPVVIELIAELDSVFIG